MKIVKCSNDQFVKISALSDHTIRMQISNTNDFEETTGPVRYGIFNVEEKSDMRVFTHNNIHTFETDFFSLTFNSETFSYVLKNKINQTELICNDIYQSANKGFKVNMIANKNEKFYGLGDTTRECLEKRGVIADIWVKNVKSYSPAPLLLSSKYFGVYSNTTYRQIFDVCKSDEDTISVFSEKGALDLLFFIGEGYNEVLKEYGNFAGKSSLLPQFAYGLTFVCNTENSARDMVDDMLNFRREGIPCDVIGLEPKWMSTYYDNTVNKKFDEERFDMPSWCLTKEGLKETFFGVIDRLGFKLSLWLCCDYDLSFEEERNAVIKKEEMLSQIKDDHLPSMDDFEQDMNIGHDPILMDKTIVKEEGWFEHLKKFTDYGAKAFKMDGAWQVNEHPDRLYGNGMDDDEMHNLYPLILNKQMSDGYEQHTNTRSMIYSSGGYAGIQQYAATWAGDTGGGPKPLTSMLNHALSGHNNTSCDMHPFTKEGIHFGFLQSWSQICSWAYWRQPWLLQKDLKEIYKQYAQFRYALIPYIYSASYKAYLKGTPVMRPLPFEYPDDEKVANMRTQYMFGDYFMVTCYTDEVYLPAGEWLDYYSNEEISGPYSGKLEIPENKGGGLFVKKGAIIPFWPEMDFVGEKKIEKLKIEIYPDTFSEYILYEDDGISLNYKKGVRSESIITCAKDGQIHITISKRNGSYDGMEVKRFYEINVLDCKNKTVTVNGVKASSIFENNFIKFEVDCTSDDCDIIIK